MMGLPHQAMFRRLNSANMVKRKFWQLNYIHQILLGFLHQTVQGNGLAKGYNLKVHNNSFIYTFAHVHTYL